MADEEKKGKSKLPIIVAAVAVVAAGGFFMMKGGGEPEAVSHEVELSAPLELGEFLVNMEHDQFLQTNVRIQVVDHHGATEGDYVQWHAADDGHGGGGETADLLVARDAVMPVLQSASADDLRDPVKRELIKVRMAYAINHALQKLHPTCPDWHGHPPADPAQDEKLAGEAQTMQEKAWHHYDGPVRRILFHQLAWQAG